MDSYTDYYNAKGIKYQQKYFESIVSRPHFHSWNIIYFTAQTSFS